MSMEQPAVELTNLNFSFPPPSALQAAEPNTGDKRVLKDISLQIPSGQRILVVGGNGAGKSTLLRVLAGRHLIPTSADRPFDMKEPALVFGRDAFRDTTLNSIRAFVASDWGIHAAAFATHAAAYSADIPVKEMMTKLQAEYPERRDHLLQLLRIDPDWRLHRLSDGQRRRVQLFLALLRPSDLILLDEVLGPLDLVSRSDLLTFLLQESERGATVLLATHIFDNVQAWATDVLYVKQGTLGFYGGLDKFLTDFAATKTTGPQVHAVVEGLLRQELREQRGLEKEEKKDSSELANAQNRAGGYAAGRLGDVLDMDDVRK